MGLFRACDVTHYQICEKKYLVKLKIDQGFQEYITSWVFDQEIKSYLAVNPSQFRVTKKNDDDDEDDDSGVNQRD